MGIFSCGGLLGSFPGLGLLQLGNLSGRLDTNQAASPVTPDLFKPLVEVGLDGLEELVVLVAVLGVGL